MKKFIALIALFIPLAASAFNSLSEQASYYQNLYGNPAGPTSVSKSSMNKGETRPKAVLKGVFYFGGSDKNRDLLSSNYQTVLCENGFSQVYSVYSKPGKSVTCNGNNMSYSHIGQAKAASNGGGNVAALMREIYDIIKAGGAEGPIYLHCFYGVHASNTIAQMVLKQFCKIDDATAVANWNKVDLYDSLGEPNLSAELAKVTGYERDPSLELTSAERDVVCY